MTTSRRDRGAVAVEFALVLPLLVLLMAGIAEFSRAYNVQTTLSGAARAGVRVMALQNNPNTAQTAVATADASLNLPTVLQCGTPPDSGAIWVCVSTAGSNGSPIVPASCATIGLAPPPTAMVTVTYKLGYITGLFGSTITITGQGVMQCGG